MTALASTRSRLLSRRTHLAHQLRQSTIISSEGGETLAHAGLKPSTVPRAKDVFVLTAAPGADVAMLAAIFVCLFNHGEGTHGNMATVACVNAAAASSVGAC